MIQNAQELGDRRQDAWLAAAVRTTLLAMKNRAVLVSDDADGFVGVLGGVGRRADDGFQPDPCSQRIQRQRISGNAAGEKHLEALLMRDPLDLGRNLVRQRMLAVRHFPDTDESPLNTHFWMRLPSSTSDV